MRYALLNDVYNNIVVNGSYNDKQEQNIHVVYIYIYNIYIGLLSLGGWAAGISLSLTA